MVLNLPLDVQAARGPARSGARRPPAPASRPRRTRPASTRWPPCSPRPSGRCSSRGAAPAAPAPRELEGSAERAGALLATSAVAKGLFRGEPVGPRRERRFRLAAGRRADPRRGPDRRLGLRAQHVDHAARPADRPGREGGPGRPRRRRARRAPAGRPRRGRRRRPRSRGGRRGARPARRHGRAATAPPRSAAASPREVRWRDVPYEDEAGGGRIDPRTLTIAARRPAARRADGGGRLRQLHGLPVDVAVGARRERVLLHPGVPVDRPRPGHRDRRRARPAGPAAGGRARRRRRADGRRRAGDRRYGSACRW